VALASGLDHVRVRRRHSAKVGGQAQSGFQTIWRSTTLQWHGGRKRLGIGRAVWEPPAAGLSAISA